MVWSTGRSCGDDRARVMPCMFIMPPSKFRSGPSESFQSTSDAESVIVALDCGHVMPASIDSRLPGVGLAPISPCFERIRPFSIGLHAICHVQLATVWLVQLARDVRLVAGLIPVYLLTVLDISVEAYLGNHNNTNTKNHAFARPMDACWSAA